jgi:ribosomal protein L11 methylase PrmA
MYRYITVHENQITKHKAMMIWRQKMKQFHQLFPLIVTVIIQYATTDAFVQIKIPIHNNHVYQELPRLRYEISKKSGSSYLSTAMTISFIGGRSGRSSVVFVCSTVDNDDNSMISSKNEAVAGTMNTHTQFNSNATKRSGITDWITENLETFDSKITYSSTTQAGENDTLPSTGLCIGKVRILPAGANVDIVGTTTTTTMMNDTLIPIRLLVGRNGWGTGVHPTTRLCLEYICDIIQGGEIMLDYGCGSGILSIAALHFGASRCIGVDVEAEALVTAERNIQLNGYGTERFEPFHTREVIPYGITSGQGVDICIANILIGQLVRPSMVAAIATNIAPGGLICFSGIRPAEISSLQDAYCNYIEEWIDTTTLQSSDCPGSIASYGYDCGEWCRLVGRTKRISSTASDILSMSDLAVS